MHFTVNFKVFGQLGLSNRYLIFFYKIYCGIFSLHTAHNLYNMLYMCYNFLGVPVPVDIKTASDIAILNQVNLLGKRVVLEVEENHPDNISAMIEYDEDSDVVLVRKFRRACTPDFLDDDEEGEEETETETSELDSVIPIDLAGSGNQKVHGKLKSEGSKSGGSMSSPLQSDAEPKLSKSSLRKSEKYDSDGKGSYLSKSDSVSDGRISRLSKCGSGSASLKSVSLASRSKDSSRSSKAKSVSNPSPEWLSSWTYNQTVKKTEEKKIFNFIDKVKKCQNTSTTFS